MTQVGVSISIEEGKILLPASLGGRFRDRPPRFGLCGLRQNRVESVQSERQGGVRKAQSPVWEEKGGSLEDTLNNRIGDFGYFDNDIYSLWPTCVARAEKLASAWFDCLRRFYHVRRLP